MRFLLTGMTAQQANPASHKRAANYMGYLYDVLLTGGHEVDWTDPGVEAPLDTYDYVVVGVAPITSLGANRSYGALSIIERLWDSPKLTLMVDAPEPTKIENSLRAIADKPENLTKPFFEYRKEYELVVKGGHAERLLSVVEKLHTQEWPSTLVPALPWHKVETLAALVPAGARANLRGGELESFVIRDHLSEPVAPLASNRWAYQPGSDKKWVNRQGISWDTYEIPWSSRAEADGHAITMIRACSGTLIAPERAGTWWNTRYGMSMAQGVPVFTNWSEAITIGSSWGTLPNVYENVTREQREYLAQTQLKEYHSAIHTVDEVVDTFNEILTGD
jgi:hypothetical protein